MTDLPYQRSAGAKRPVSWAVSPRTSWIAALYCGVAVGAGTGLVVAASAVHTAPLEWQLSLLLRFMAVVKAAMVLGAVGLTHWRFGRPIGPRVATGYVLSIALMTVAPGLIWSLAHVALGAAVFHTGLLTCLVLAWRDDAAGRLLSRRSAADGTRN